jgi:hypothetical protein
MARLRIEAAWNLKRIFRRFFPMRWRRVGQDKPISMVLLLRKPHRFSEEELRTAAEKAWGVSFAGINGSTRTVTQSEDSTSLQAGSHLLSFRNSSRPYVDKPEDDVNWLPRASQQRAWAEHRACIWVDYVTPGTDVELAHCVLSGLVARLIDENCTGVYAPSEDSLIPADESLYEDLQKMASYRDQGVVPAR